MLKIVNGYSPEYLLKEVSTGRENYYTGAVAEGEPPGRWWGVGAETLGLRGLVDAQDMRGVYERFLDPREDGFSDPARWDEVFTLGHPGRKYATEEELFKAALEREPDATAERRAELRTEAGRNARHNVAFFDATFSVQKSVTLLHTAFEAKEVAARNAGNEEEAAAWAEFRKAVEDAIWAGNNAGLTFLQGNAAYTRVGHHGGAAGRYADAHGFVVGSFFQHDSRDHDPQLHIHNTILNRVQSPDGVWRTLDSRGLHRWRPGAAAVAERTTDERIVATLGMLLATRPDGKAREVLGVSAEAMSLISNRRHAVTAKTAELVETFEARYGKSPNNYQLERLAQQATLATRQSKTATGESREELLDRVAERMRVEIDGGLSGIADAALAARPADISAMAWSPEEVIAHALAEVQQSKAAWTKPDLIRALNNALPDVLGIADGDEVGELLSTLAGHAIATGAVELETTRPAEDVLPDEYRLANGESAFGPPGGKLYATHEHLETERTLATAAGARDGAVMAGSSVERFLATLRGQGTELGVAQAAAVRGVLTSGARVETLVGPPGTGKSFVVGTLARAWTDPGLTGGPERRVFGLATSQAATEILADQGLTSRNIAAWLATQGRLDRGTLRDDADLGFRLHGSDIVVVDESAMTDTHALAAVHRYADEAGAKLLLVGDPRQLAAVGAGGGMELVGDAGGARYELNEARRFIYGWERDASLRLREGDTTVLDEYHRQGRLRDCGTEAQAEQSAADAWLADTLDGKNSLLLVDSNKQADRLSSEIRVRLVELGLVAEDGVLLGRTGAHAGVGDIVEARSIGHDLAGYEGNRRGPHTRERFRVLAIRPDGGLEVTNDTKPGAASDGDEVAGERMVLSPHYVASELALGYAGTRYCGQGATVYSTHSVVTGQTDHAAALVGLTRGQEANTAHCATTTEVDDAADGTDAHRLHRSPKAMLETALVTAEPDRSALTVQQESKEWAGLVQTAAELLADGAHLAAVRRTTTWLDRLTDDGALTQDQRDQLAAEDGAASLTRVLRSAEVAGYDPYALLQQAIEHKSLAGARSLTNVVYARLRDANTFEPADGQWADRVPRLDDPQMQRYLDRLAEDLDDHTTRLGTETAADPPRWATDLLGPVPDQDDAQARAEWERSAGAVATSRAMAGREDTDHDAAVVDAGDVLGPPPKPGMVEHHAAYCAGWNALGRPTAEREELAMSDGQHLMRIRAFERQQAWAPRYVANELAGTRQAADQHRHTATLNHVEADAAPDPDRADEMRQAAAEAAKRAEALDRQVGELEEIDQARSTWLVRTAVDRDKYDRSTFALAQRHVDRNAPDERVTAEEWNDAHRAATLDGDQHRPITETDLADTPDLDADRHADDRRRDDQSSAATSTANDAAVNDEREEEREREHVLETEVPDLRDVAAAEPAQTGEDDVRVPPADESSDNVDRARRAVAEIRAQQAYEASLDDAQDRDVNLTREDPFTNSTEDAVYADDA